MNAIQFFREHSEGHFISSAHVQINSCVNVPHIHSKLTSKAYFAIKI